MKRVIFLTIFFALSACGDCGSDNNSNNTIDIGQDTGDDMSMMQPDVGIDVAIDMAPADADGDGILNADDNCPTVANPDQLDRDRDTVGDVCDNFPFISDPTNPEMIPTVIEDETVIENDNGDAGEDYDLTLPFIADGAVGVVDEVGPDLDWYSFELTEPTALIIHVQPNATMWAGAIVVGRDFRNANVFRVALAPMAGDPIDREMFIAAPGKYAMVVSDVQNFIADAGDVGGPDYQYTASLSTIPLPELETIDLPTAPLPQTFLNRIRAFEVNTTGVAGLYTDAVGNTVEMNNFHNPALTLIDADTNRVLAFTGLAEIGDDEKVELDVQLNNVNRMLLIEDFTERFGSSTSTISLREANQTEETERGGFVADERIHRHSWIGIGSTIRGQIDGARDVGGILRGDRDYFLFSAKRGDQIRVTVQPDVGSPLIPAVQIGHYINNQGTSSFFLADHRAEPVLVPEDPTIVEYIIDSDEDGEYAIQIEHDPNIGNQMPVGGNTFGYEVRLEAWTPTVQNLGALPANGSVSFENGSIGVVSFDAQPNEIVTVSVSAPSVFVDSRVIDPTSFLRKAFGSRTAIFRSDGAQAYQLDIKDFLGRSTEGTPADVTISSATPTDLGALPSVVNDTLDDTARHFYTFTASAGDVIDLRVGTSAFFPEITVYDEDFNRLFLAFEDRVFEIESDGTYLVGVGTSSGDVNPSYDYSIGVQIPNPTPLGNLPANQAGVLNPAPFGAWYSIDVTAGTNYQVRYDSPAFFSRVTVYDPATLQTIATGSNDVARWTAAEDATLWVLFAHDRNLGDPTFDYTLDFGQLTSQVLTDGVLLAGAISQVGESTLYEINVPPGAISATIQPVGDWRPTIELLELDSLRRVFDAAQIGLTLRYAQSLNESYFVAVTVADAAVVGPYDFTIEYNHTGQGIAVSEVEPNNTPAQGLLVVPPAVVNGTTAANIGDYFLIDLLPGQRLWAMVTDRNNNGVNRFDAELRFFDFNNTFIRNNLFSGEGFLPAIYGQQIDVGGQYQIYYGPDNNGMLSGDYAIYFLTSPVTVFSEIEPNNDIAGAQVSPPFEETLNFAGTTTVADPSDVFSFDVLKSTTRVTVHLDSAAPGHTIRLLDALGAPLAESGTGFDGLLDPSIAVNIAAPTTLYVEFGNGIASGSANVVVTKTP